MPMIRPRDTSFNAETASRATETARRQHTPYLRVSAAVAAVGITTCQRRAARPGPGSRRWSAGPCGETQTEPEAHQSPPSALSHEAAARTVSAAHRQTRQRPEGNHGAGRYRSVNQRPAGLSSHTRPAGGGGVDSALLSNFRTTGHWS